MSGMQNVSGVCFPTPFKLKSSCGITAISLRTKPNDNNTNDIVRSKLVRLVILCVVSVFQTARAVQWERVIGGESPGEFTTTPTAVLL